MDGTTSFATITAQNSRANSRRICYYLFRRKGKNGDAYYIRVIYNGESCTRQLPTGQVDGAREMFGCIVRGAVTPCALDDVLEDMKN